jgi:uncharacterized membrane protein YvbJ
MPAKNKSVSNSVCLNHPDRSAETRCVTCFKPLCSECAIRDAEGNDFCSEQCRRNYENSRENVDNFHAQERRIKRRKKIRRLVILVILIVLGVAAYKHFKDNPDDLKKLKHSTETLREKAKTVTKEVAK